MKNLILLAVLFFSANSFAASPVLPVSQIAAEDAVKEIYNLEKDLISIFQTTETCIFGKCSNSVERQRKNTKKYIDLPALYSESLNAKCAANPGACQGIFMLVSSQRQLMEMSGRPVQITSLQTTEKTFDVIVSLEGSSRKTTYQMICEKTCLIEGLKLSKE